MAAARPILGAVAGIVAALVVHAAAMAADDDARILAPTGTLRAALYPGTPTSILDPKESEPRGVGYELGRELAKRLGVPYSPVVYARNADVQAAMKAGAADVAFTNASPARQKDMDFGPPYLLIELGYLVPAASAIASPADVDGAGRRVGVVTGSTSEATLSSTLKQAQVVRAATNRDGAELVAAGAVDAFATNKATLFELVDEVKGTKVLPGTWGEERHSVGIPKGRDQGLPTIRAFTADVLAQGLVKAAMDRAGLKGARPAGP